MRELSKSVALFTRTRKVLSRIKYDKPWCSDNRFTVRDRNGVIMLRHEQLAKCIKTGRTEWQKGRWYFISEHSTDDEILRTAFLAVKVFEEHEINETFLVDGERFLNPHPEGPRPDNRAGPISINAEREVIKSVFQNLLRKVAGHEL